MRATSVYRTFLAPPFCYFRAKPFFICLMVQQLQGGRVLLTLECIRLSLNHRAGT